jgi:hypothetical protein
MVVISCKSCQPISSCVRTEGLASLELARAVVRGCAASGGANAPGNRDNAFSLRGYRLAMRRFSKIRGSLRLERHVDPGVANQLSIWSSQPPCGAVAEWRGRGRAISRQVSWRSVIPSGQPQTWPILKSFRGCLFSPRTKNRGRIAKSLTIPSV